MSFNDIYRTVLGADVGTAGPEFTLVYSSAHWCAPCRRFTPILKEVYSDWVMDGEKVEVIFVSSDRNEDQFHLYSATMPWQLLPFQERKLADAFKSRYGVSSIPSLLVFDKNGQLVTNCGRQSVHDKRGRALDEWRQKVLERSSSQ